MGGGAGGAVSSLEDTSANGSTCEYYIGSKSEIHDLPTAGCVGVGLASPYIHCCVRSKALDQKKKKTGLISYLDSS